MLNLYARLKTKGNTENCLSVLSVRFNGILCKSGAFKREPLLPDPLILLMVIVPR